MSTPLAGSTFCPLFSFCMGTVQIRPDCTGFVLNRSGSKGLHVFIKIKYKFIYSRRKTFEMKEVGRTHATGQSVQIADESTIALDVTIQVQIMNLLRELQENTSTFIILNTHDMCGGMIVK
jgi:regulator of protease activity HflC (stomatin/prohibitin superfamily)